MAERWIQSAKTETLAHFIVFGEEHLRHLFTYHNELRPHQWNHNRPLSGAEPAGWTGTITAAAVVYQERLGGLLKHYSRQAA